jgi:hypothetical protein
VNTETTFSEQEMLEQVEGLGLRVYFVHIRNLQYGGQSTARRARDMNNTLAARGGVTVAVLRNDRGRNFVQGVAHCSTQDNYCKATGRRIALHRALYGMTPIFPAETSV